MATGGTSDTERGGEEFFDFLCVVCKGKNKYTEAVKFCSDCHTYYCDSCVELHNFIPTLKGHRIIDKAQFSLVTSQQFPVVPTERCENHGRKLVDMYCKQHDTVGCATCMVVDHRACHDTVYVPEYIKTNASADIPKDVSTELSSIATSLKEVEASFTKNKQMLANSKQNVLKHIRKFREEINQQLDILEKKMETELEHQFQSLLNQIEEILRDLQASGTEVNSTLDSLQSANGNQSQLFVNMKKASNIANKANEKIKTLKIAVSMPEITFSENHKLKSLLQETDNFGSINTQDNAESQSTSPPNSHTQQTLTSIAPSKSQSQSLTSPNIQVPQTLTSSTCSKSESQKPKETAQFRDNTASGQHTPLLKIKGKKTYSVKVKSDRNTSCIIYGACALEDGTVVLTDYDNRKLKRLDSSTYTVRDCCDVPSWPYQVCVTSQQEVAVACSTSKLIQFVSVGDTMQTTRKIYTDHESNGLAYADGKLFVADRASVYVYTMTEDVLQPFNKDMSEQSLFSCTFSLAVSRDNSKIYVVDGDMGLIILDRNGKLARQLSFPELSAAAYVCLYKDDNILVCGRDSMNVLQFNADGELMGEVLKTDKPCTSVCWINSKLIVGYFDNNIDCYDVCV